MTFDSMIRAGVLAIVVFAGCGDDGDATTLATTNDTSTSDTPTTSGASSSSGGSSSDGGETDVDITTGSADGSSGASTGSESSGASTGSESSGAGETSTGTIPVGGDCTDDAECQSGVCWDFADYDPLCFGAVCSGECRTDDDCIQLATDAGAQSPEGAHCGDDGRCDLVGTGLGTFACANQ
jgi:hypothetical protein